MNKLIISIIFLICTGPALANPALQVDKEVSQALLDRYAVAVMIDASGASSIPADDRIYQLLVGKLQREMRKAEILVFNGVLPEAVATDRMTLKGAIDELANPYLDTVLLIGAVLDPATTSAPDVQLQLTLQFVDATSGMSFAALDELSTLPIAADCDEVCWSRVVNRRVISMGKKLTDKAIVAMQFDSQRHDVQITAAL